MEEEITYTAFADNDHLVSGSLEKMLRRTKQYLEDDGSGTILIFEDHSGVQVDFDFRGTFDEVLARLASHPLLAGHKKSDTPRGGPGRPRLGVVCREVSLLPRHWEWLEEQPNGISAALRRLVDEARKREPHGQCARRAREAAGRFMMVMAGNRPGYEEASRALFAKDQEALKKQIRRWPPDIRRHLWLLVQKAAQLEAGTIPPK
jgi:uncharacterized protein